MVGRSIIRLLSNDNESLIFKPSRNELDYLDQISVEKYFGRNKINQVYIAAAKVGGIYANDTFPATFIYENIQIASNIINAAHKNDINKILFLGSSCIYPKNAQQPISEDQLFNGYLESTNEAYAISKIAGIKLCESYNRQYGRDYRSIMPCNLYGPFDNFDEKESHVIPALIRKFLLAKKNSSDHVKIWGSGRPRREFLHVDDLAKACKLIMNLDTSKYREITSPMISHINVGAGEDISITELAQIIMKKMDYYPELVFDESKPDGTFKKLLDISNIKKLGWKPNIPLEDGILETISWAKNNITNLH